MFVCCLFAVCPPTVLLPSSSSSVFALSLSVSPVNPPQAGQHGVPCRCVQLSSQRSGSHPLRWGRRLGERGGFDDAGLLIAGAQAIDRAVRHLIGIKELVGLVAEGRARGNNNSRVDLEHM